jgi:hypothetical protein
MNDNFTRISIDDLTTPKDGLVVVTNSWWSVTSKNEVLFYTKNGANSPQCNKHKSIAKRLGGAVNTKPVFIPIAFVPGSCYYGA